MNYLTVLYAAGAFTSIAAFSAYVGDKLSGWYRKHNETRLPATFNKHTEMIYIC